MTSLIQSAQTSVGNIFGGGTTNSTPLNLPGAVTIGNLIVIEYFSQSSTRNPDSVVDTPTTDYSLDLGGAILGSAGGVRLWAGIAAATNAGQGIVVTCSGNNGDKSLLRVTEWDALTLTGVSHNEATGASVTTHNSGNVTPANASGLIVAIANRTNGDWTDPGDFTEVNTTDDNFYSGYKISPAASAQQLTMLSDVSEFSEMKIIALAGVVAAANNQRRLLLGVG